MRTVAVLVLLVACGGGRAQPPTAAPVRTYDADARTPIAREPIDAGVTPAVVAIEPPPPPVAIEPDVPPDTPATCDIAPFIEASNQLLQAGMFAAALVKLEAALKCKPGDQGILALAFIAACEIKHTPKQKHFYQRMTKQTRDKVIQRRFRPKPPPDDFPIP